MQATEVLTHQAGYLKATGGLASLLSGFQSWDVTICERICHISGGLKKQSPSRTNKILGN